MESLELSFKNVRELFGKVDDIPDRAKWKTATLVFPENPDEEHTVHFCDILEAIQALLGNPAHTKHIVYWPRRVFSFVFMCTPYHSARHMIMVVLYNQEEDNTGRAMLEMKL